MTRADLDKYKQDQNVMLWYWDQLEGRPVYKNFIVNGLQFAHNDEKDQWSERYRTSAYCSIYENLQELIDYQVRLKEKEISALQADILKIKSYSEDYK